MSIEELICEKIIYCQNCHKNSARTIIQIRDYLCFNVEHFYESIYFSVKKTFPNINLNDIPTTIRLQNKSYILCGAIQFVPSTITNGIRYYIEYVRSLTNKWTEINNLCKELKNNVNNFPEIKISLLFYYFNYHFVLPEIFICYLKSSQIITKIKKSIFFMLENNLFVIIITFTSVLTV